MQALLHGKDKTRVRAPTFPPVALQMAGGTLGPPACNFLFVFLVVVRTSMVRPALLMESSTVLTVGTMLHRRPLELHHLASLKLHTH